MNNYEILFIIKPDLKEEDLKNVIKAINDSVAKNGGTVSKEDNWGKKQLVYPVKKSKEGYYYKLDFTAPANAIEKLEAGHRLNADILRTMVTKR
ncbi:MAG: 30S ribosomal protein S6 [Candidatus Omnitrophica bacterium]|nr:30S ribosomal protein S6 [Candidatus Omnitrophota bacterium]MDD5436972.1 30S ribosomal protein S6 [Candidatus Omnitrophota bacterium]